MMKLCQSCRTEKTLSDFSTRRTFKGTLYYRTVCKPCYNTAQNVKLKEKRQQRKEQIEQSYKAGVNVYTLSRRHDLTVRGIKIMCKVGPTLQRVKLRERVWKEPEVKTYFLSPEELQRYRAL